MWIDGQNGSHWLIMQSDIKPRKIILNYTTNKRIVLQIWKEIKILKNFWVDLSSEFFTYYKLKYFWRNETNEKNFKL